MFYNLQPLRLSEQVESLLSVGPDNQAIVISQRLINLLEPICSELGLKGQTVNDDIAFCELGGSAEWNPLCINTDFAVRADDVPFFA